MYRYTYHVFWHEPDESYVAVISGVPELQFLSAFGDTPQAALDDMMSVLQAVEESYREEGRELPIAPVLAEAG
jgi:predicted RNase H-like HicB family nuclease